MVFNYWIKKSMIRFLKRMKNINSIVNYCKQNIKNWVDSQLIKKENEGLKKSNVLLENERNMLINKEVDLGNNSCHDNQTFANIIKQIREKIANVKHCQRHRQKYNITILFGSTVILNLSESNKICVSESVTTCLGLKRLTCIAIW